MFVEALTPLDKITLFKSGRYEENDKLEKL